jgi:diguanylate cyclase (GGDEF)-like protein
MATLERALAMSLDLSTLFVIAVFTAAVGGVLLLLSWLQNRNIRALAYWAAAFMVAAVGVALISARGDIPDVWSIVVGNAIIAGGYGIMWGGVRNFEGHEASVPLMLAGTLIWLLACQFEPFYALPPARIALMSAIVTAYSVLCAWEFWQGRSEGLMSRLPIIALFLVHAAVFILRIPLAGTLSMSMDSTEAHPDLWTFIIFEALFFAVCSSYLLGGMARERVALWYKRASLVDPLTGASNRRAFFGRGEKLLHRTVFDRRPAVLLVLDLDNFKSINDTFGHHVGDRVLTTFCTIATAALRPDDLFGRLGGEEFGALLPRTSLKEVLTVAERIRAGFEAMVVEAGASRLSTTVSIGVAVTTDPTRHLVDLINEADQALYRAKANGRNRIEHLQGEPESPTERMQMARPRSVVCAD